MKKTYKIIAAAVAVILVGCILVGIFNNKMTAEAKASLPGVESIVGANSNSNSYDILEVVANKNDARFGYLVGGEEPVSEGKSLKDMLTAEHRTAAMTAFSSAGITDLITGGALAYTPGYAEGPAGTKEIQIRGRIEDTVGGEYKIVSSDATYRVYDPAEWVDASGNPINVDRYAEFVDWSLGNGYAISFKEATVLSDKQIVYTDGNTYGIYNAYQVNNEATVSSLTETELAAMEGRYVYIKDMVANTYTYYGKVVLQDKVDGDGNPVLDGSGNPVRIGMVEVADGAGTIVAGDSLGYNYLLTDFTLNRAGGSYVISGYTPVAGGYGGFDIYKHWEYDENGGYVIDNASIDAITYVGAGNGDKSFTANTAYSVVENVNYDNGFVNDEWLKKYTFDINDGATNSFVINVITVTVDEFNSMSKSVADYDMVILSAGAYTTDFGKQQAQALVVSAIDKKLPTVIETGFDSNPAGCPNIHKVAVALRQNNLSDTLAGNAVSNWDINDYWRAAAGGLESKVRALSAANYAYVEKSVLVYDSVSTGTRFANGNFKTTVSDSLKNFGFSAVANELANENFYRARQGLSTINDAISMATALRYIVNFSSQRVIIKSSIKVLEIEPCYSFLDVYSVGTGKSNDLKKVYYDTRTVTVNNLTHEIISPQYIAQNWAPQFQSDSSKINLTQTYTREFIGKIEDLNENYDMIYIGLDTTTMNTELEGYRRQGNLFSGYTYVADKKTNKTVYNDTSMNGLIYTHIGDLITYSSSTTTLNWPSSNRVPGWNSSFTDRKYRLSGNDITERKLYDIEEYIQAGYPVVFHDNFFTYNSAKTIAVGVNTGVIDSSSNMYKLAQFALSYTDRNVFFDSQIKQSGPDTDENAIKNRLSNYLNLSKLSVSMTRVPTEYVASNTSPAYLQKVNGEYYLIYEFALKNDAVYDTAGTSYDVNLFIDSSVDGRFSNDEEIPSLSVYEHLGEKWNEVHVDAHGRYNLLAGRNYKIERIVPNGYVGVLPWKLLFTQNVGTGTSLVRVSQSGYTAIPVPSYIRQEIKVLQITTNSTDDSYKSNYLDLTSADVTRQMNLIQDFDIKVTKISANDYFAAANPSNAADTSGYLSYLNQYDMLVLGFSDCYEMYFTGSNANKNPAAATAIQQYISSGKSILFTHDTTSFNNRSAGESWGFNFNKYVRGVVGMDRFNVLGLNTASDTAYTPKSGGGTADQHIQGYSDGTILGNISSSSLLRSTCRYAQYDGRSGQYSGSSNPNYVTKVNDGQITNYPFAIPNTFKVATTHYQYYQLNLDTDSTDDNPNDDIVVWYCISDIAGAETDDMYQATPNDVRNNYYIYNMGNVTYSGVGHSSVSTSGSDPTELRLFLNTMVAAYKAGKHPPKVTYKNSGESSAATIETKGVLYDQAMNGGAGKFLDDKVSVYFEVTDTSFVQGERRLVTNYYIKCSASEKDIAPVINGETVYLKEIRPAVYKIKSDGTEVQIQDSRIKLLDTDTSYRLEIDTSVLLGAPVAGGGVSYKKDASMVYIAAETEYIQANGNTDSSGIGYYPMTFYRVELMDLE